MQKMNEDTGFSFEYASAVLGFHQSKASSSDYLNQTYDAFCNKSNEQIAYSETFFNKFRSSDIAVTSWRQCIETVSNKEGHYAAAIPAADLTGAVVILRRTGQGSIPGLQIQSVEPAGAYQVTCTYAGRPVVGIEFPDSQREIAINCTKTANINVDFIINSNWGIFSSFSVPGYGGRVSQLETSVATLSNAVATLQAQLGDLSAMVSRTEATRTDQTTAVENGGWRNDHPLSAVRLSATCPAGQVAVGLDVISGGTCKGQCDYDGRPVANFRVICAPLALTR